MSAVGIVRGDDKSDRGVDFARSLRRFPGIVHLAILFGIATLRMAWSSGSGCVPWAFGTSRLEGLDHVIVFGEAHLRRILGRYAAY
jgi:hypothetical protein